MKLHPLTEELLAVVAAGYGLASGGCLCLSGWPFTHVHKSNTV